MSSRKTALKSVLWLLVGILVTVTVARFTRGLGATTALSDAAPWGLWIAFDVMCGVALAAGGFVVSGIVYIFHLEKYHPLARPAILTAFLGYFAVAVGLMYDLGVPYNIWHPIIYQQHHSVLFEVAMCVMLYLTVLFLEFAPAILEHPLFDRPVLHGVHRFLKKATIPLVVTGIVLSTLHQSSLGSLFLIAPYRVHPLWYSPIIYVLFFFSAIGLGLMMVTAESMFSSWYFGHKLRTDLLSGLGAAASVVLFLYAALRLGDLALRGVLASAFDGSWQANVFLLEIGLSVLLPATLLAFRRVRTHAVGLGFSSAMTILGVMGYRFDLAIVTFTRPAGMSYFPSWIEIAVSVGLVAAMMLIFIFFVENLKVSEPEHEEEPVVGPGRAETDFDPFGTRLMLPESLAGMRRYSLAVTVGIALAAAFLPAGVWTRNPLARTPVQAPRIMNGVLPASYGVAPVIDPSLSASPSQAETAALPAGSRRAQLFLIDGNRDGRLVAFDHQIHQEKMGGKASCVQCHHMSLPFDQNSSCRSCHRDMYLKTDIFSHTSHISKLGKNRSCTRCHRDPNGVKTRATAKPCLECHRGMMRKGSLVSVSASGMHGLADGYVDAMHSLCIDCHKRKIAEEPAVYKKSFAECRTCHQGIDGSEFLEMSPYRTSGDETTLPLLTGTPERNVSARRADSKQQAEYAQR